jgi:hypothetical protein
MSAVDNLDTAVDNPASCVPALHSARLAPAQKSHQQACTHMPDAVICSAVDVKPIEALPEQENTMTSENKWTPEAIRALEPTTDLPTLGAIFECSRWKAYQMARHGEWERVGIKIIPIGSKYRVVVQSILDVLGYGRSDLSTQEAPRRPEPIRNSADVTEAKLEGRPRPPLVARTQRCPGRFPHDYDSSADLVCQ